MFVLDVRFVEHLILEDINQILTAIFGSLNFFYYLYIGGEKIPYTCKNALFEVYPHFFVPYKKTNCLIYSNIKKYGNEKYKWYKRN